MRKLQEKGITLIALVITIIVMLILVGVTISVITNGGLIDQAKIAKTDTRVASYKEKIMVEIAGLKAASASEGGNIQDNPGLTAALTRACPGGTPIQDPNNGKPIGVTTKEGDVIYLEGISTSVQQQDFFADGNMVKIASKYFNDATWSNNTLNIPSSNGTVIGALSFASPEESSTYGTLYSRFNGADQITEIRIQSGITTIEDYAFGETSTYNSGGYYNYNFDGYKFYATRIIIPATVTTISANAFKGWTSNQTICCEAATKPDGWAEGWNAGAIVEWNYAL